MPTYQYQCTQCGAALEVIQSFSDDALTECPECAGRLRKVFNAVGIVFKGSGFYRNDSRDAGSKAPAAHLVDPPLRRHRRSGHATSDLVDVVDGGAGHPPVGAGVLVVVEPFAEESFFAGSVFLVPSVDGSVFGASEDVVVERLSLR